MNRAPETAPVSGSVAPKTHPSCGASAGRAEKRTSDDCLTTPAFAGGRRTPCDDQDQHPNLPLQQWRIGANADRSACGAFFDLTTRPGRIAPQARHAFVAATRSSTGVGVERPARFGGVMSEPRRDADSPLREFEKRPAGVPNGEGAAIVPTACTTSLSNRSLTGLRITRAGAGIVRHAPKGCFSGRRPRRRGSDMTPPTLALAACVGQLAGVWKMRS